MIGRLQEERIIKDLQWFPAVAVIGPRQVGKTTLVKEIIKKHYKDAIYLDLESVSDLAVLDNAEIFLRHNQDKLVVIDEVQRRPDLFPILRSLIDGYKRNGRFLILGSAGPNLLKQSSESLAGRISYIELSAFHFTETNYENLQDLWLKGGFPDSFLSPMEKSIRWRENFIKTFLERDLPQFGIRIPSTTLHRFWTMLAHVHGQTLNANYLAKSLGTTPVSINRYLDILESTFMIRRLLPAHANLKKRLVKSPKIYLRDTGVLHSLLNIKSDQELHGNPILGNSWEGFVIEQIAHNNSNVTFYRSQAGAEMDLIMAVGNEKWGIEIKYSDSPKVTRGFWQVMEDLKLNRAFVIYPGGKKYELSKNVTVCNINQFVQTQWCH